MLRSFVWISRKQVQITRGMGEGVVQATCNVTPVTEFTTKVVIKRTIVRGDKQVPQDYCLGDVSTAHADEFFEELTELEEIASVAPEATSR